MPQDSKVLEELLYICVGTLLISSLTLTAVYFLGPGAPGPPLPPWANREQAGTLEEGEVFEILSVTPVKDERWGIIRYLDSPSSSREWNWEHRVVLIPPELQAEPEAGLVQYTGDRLVPWPPE